MLSVYIKLTHRWKGMPSLFYPRRLEKLGNLEMLNGSRTSHSNRCYCHLETSRIFSALTLYSQNNYNSIFITLFPILKCLCSSLDKHFSPFLASKSKMVHLILFSSGTLTPAWLIFPSVGLRFILLYHFHLFQYLLFHIFMKLNIPPLKGFWNFYPVILQLISYTLLKCKAF